MTVCVLGCCCCSKDGIEKLFKAEGIPWPGHSLMNSVRLAALIYARAYMTTAVQVSTNPQGP